MSASEETKPKDDSAAEKGTWKKCLSRRLKKFYYYNSVTKESKWSMDDVIEPLKMVESKESICSGSGLHPDRPNCQALQNGHMFPEPDCPPTLDGAQYSDLSTNAAEVHPDDKLKLLSVLLKEPTVFQILESHFEKFLNKRTEAGTSGSRNSHVTSTENVNTTTQNTDMVYQLRSIDFETIDPRTPSHATDLPLNERFKHTPGQSLPKNHLSASVNRVSSSNSFCLDRTNCKSEKFQDVESTVESCTKYNDIAQIGLVGAIDKSDDSAEISPGPPEEVISTEEGNVQTDLAKKVKFDENLPPNDLRLTLRKRRQRRMSENPDSIHNEVWDHSDNAETLFLLDEAKIEDRLKEFKERSILETSVSENDTTGDYCDAVSVASSKRVKFAPDTMEDEAPSESEFSAVHLERLANLYHHVYGEGDWYLIIDTNILLSNLTFVQAICNVSEGEDIAPLILIPWIVISELDNIKDANKNLSTRLRKAKTFLNNHLSTRERKSKVVGQTVLENSTKMFRCFCSDDEILNCCMQKVHEGYHVGLLSNDVNLCNKAIVNNITAYSVKSLKLLLHENKMKEIDETINTSNTSKDSNNKFDQKELSSIQIFVHNEKNQRKSLQMNVEDEKTTATNSGYDASQYVSTLRRNIENDVKSFSTNPKHVTALSSSLGNLNLGLLTEHSTGFMNDQTIIASTANVRRPRKREPIVFDANDLKQKHHVLKKSKLDTDTNDQRKINDASDNIFRRFNSEHPTKNMSNTVMKNCKVVKGSISNPFESNQNLNIFRQVNVANGQIDTLKSPEKLSNPENVARSENIVTFSQKQPTPKKPWVRQSTNVTSSTQNNLIHKKKVLLKRKKIVDSDSHDSTSQSSTNLNMNIKKRNTQISKQNVISTSIDLPSKSTNIFGETPLQRMPIVSNTSFPNTYFENKSNIFNVKVKRLENDYENMSKVRKFNENQTVNTTLADGGVKPGANEISSTQNDMLPLEKDIVSGKVVLTKLNKNNNNYDETYKILQEASGKLVAYEKKLEVQTNVGVSKRMNFIRKAVNEQKSGDLIARRFQSVPKKSLWTELSIDEEKGQSLIEEEWQSWSCVIRQLLENVLATFLEEAAKSGSKNVCEWILPSPWSLHDALGCLVRVMQAGIELGSRQHRKKIVDLANQLSQIINKYCCAGDLKLPIPTCEVFLEFFSSSRLLVSNFFELKIANWITDELEQAKSYFENILNNLQYYIRENFVESEHGDMKSRSSSPDGDGKERTPSPVRNVTISKEDALTKVLEYLNKYYPGFPQKSHLGGEEINITGNENVANKKEKSTFDKIMEEMDLSANIKKNVKFDNIKKTYNSNALNPNSTVNIRLVDTESKDASKTLKNDVENTKLTNSDEKIDSSVVKKKLDEETKGKNATKARNIVEKKNAKKKFDFSDFKFSRTITNDRLILTENEPKKIVEIISDEIVVPSNEKENLNDVAPKVVGKLNLSVPKSGKEIVHRALGKDENDKENSVKNQKRSNSEDSGIVNGSSSLVYEDANVQKCESDLNMLLALKAIRKTVTSNMEKWKNISDSNDFRGNPGAEPIVSDNLKNLINGIKGCSSLGSGNDAELVLAAEAINQICEEDLGGRKVTKNALKNSLEHCDSSFLIGLQKLEEISEIMCKLME